MSLSRSLAEKLRRGESLPAVLDAPLRAVTPAFQLAMRRRLSRPAERTTAYVISFGNITAGGAGKTPAVIERARREIADGYAVAILTRGYRAPAGPHPAVSTELTPADYYPVLGDEPALILQKVPRAIVVKNRNRNAAARRAIDEFGCNVLILDDGFQYTALDRDENFLLIDAANPFGNGALLPRGILREPLGALARATAVVLTRCDQAKNLTETINTIRQFASDVPIRKTIHAPTQLRRLIDGEILPLKHLRNTRVSAVCAIGHPEAFYATIEALGARIVQRNTLPDHAAWDTTVLPADHLVVTTEKDAVRIQNPPENLVALEIELRDAET